MAYTILIVDDSLPMRQVIKRTCKAAGYGRSEFLEAANGKQALDQLKSNWVDLILTDYNMPVMNGLEFVKAVKSRDLFKDIPVVVVSTEGNQARIREFKDWGASGYLTKPFAAEAVRDLIVEYLGEVDDAEQIDDSNEGFDF